MVARTQFHCKSNGGRPKPSSDVVDLLMNTRSKSTLPASADKQVSGNVKERNSQACSMCDVQRMALRAGKSSEDDIPPHLLSLHCKCKS